MRIGFSEVVVILVLALALIRPTKLVEVAHNLGKLLGIVKDSKEEIVEASSKITKEVVEAVQPIKEAIEPIKEIKEEIKEEIQSTIKNGGLK